VQTRNWDLSILENLGLFLNLFEHNVLQLVKLLDSLENLDLPMAAVNFSPKLDHVLVVFKLDLGLESDFELQAVAGRSHRRPDCSCLVCEKILVLQIHASAVHSALLGVEHQNDEGEVSEHVESRGCHHECRVEHVFLQNNHSDELRSKVERPEKLARVPGL